MRRIMIGVLFNSGIEKTYEVEQIEALTDKEMIDTINELKKYFAHAFKEDQPGNFTFAYDKFSTRRIVIRLKDVSAIDVYEGEVE